MKRLLWKELREKWIWLLALSASVIVPLLFGDRYFFLGEAKTQWMMLSFLVALGFGASAYSSELAGESADFIRSRPVSWKKTLIAKLIVGISFLLIALILSAIVYRIVCPSQYIRFANPINLVEGVAEAFLITGICYLSGFLCSVVLPGMFGGLLVGFIIVVTGLIEFLTYDRMKLHGYSVWSVYLRFIGAAFATVIIARFGTTISTERRIAKYFAVIGIFILIGIPLNFLVHYDPLTNNTYRSYNMSDDGKYAVTQQWSSSSDSYHSYLIRLADNKAKWINWEPNTVTWSNSSYIWRNGTFATITSDNKLWMGYMNAYGRLQHTGANLDSQLRFPISIVPSPSGKMAMAAAHSDSKGPVQIAFADMDNHQIFNVTLPNGIRDYWWQSDKEIGYIDEVGRNVMPISRK